MNKVFLSALVFAFTAFFTSCSKDDVLTKDDVYTDEIVNPLEGVQNIELRATTLGYTDVNAYIADVTQQYAAGDYKNCCIYSDGAYHICPYPEHAGINSDGTAHHGANHYKMHDPATCTNPNCPYPVCTHDSTICTNPNHNHGGNNNNGHNGHDSNGHH